MNYVTPCNLPDGPHQLAGDPLMPGNSQVNMVDLDHSRPSCRVDDSVSDDGPDVALMKLSQYRRHIGLPGFGGDHSAAIPAPLEVVPAEIQDDESRSFRHG